MSAKPAIKYLVAVSAAGVLLLASKAPDGGFVHPRAGLLTMLPGDPLPAVSFSAPEPVLRVREALSVPLEAAAERLSTLANSLFPSLWDAPKPAPRPGTYSVRDTALRLVKETL